VEKEREQETRAAREAVAAAEVAAHEVRQGAEELAEAVRRESAAQLTLTKSSP